MSSKWLSVRLLAAFLLVTSPLALQAKAINTVNTVDAPRVNIHIANFGQVDDHYYRGAQPSAADYRDLAALGVKTVVDLTRDGRADEASLVQAAGMKFVRIPLTTTQRPSDEAIAEFLKLVNDSANQPVYVHCQGGRHRTGAMTAVYRMTQDGWTADQAYAEMKHYKFEGFPGHPELKSFVYDYYTHVAHAQNMNR